MTINQTFKGKIITVAQSHDSSLWGGQTTTTNWDLTVYFLDKETKKFRLLVKGEHGTSGIAGVEELLNSVMSTIPGKVRCGSDKEGFYIRHTSKKIDGIDVTTTLAGRLAELVEKDLCRIEAAIIKVGREENSPIHMVTQIKQLYSKAETLQELYESLKQLETGEVFAERRYLK